MQREDTMKEKDQYTLNELCDNLEIPISDFCKRAAITEGTLARIRKGFSARRSTINKMLRVFSEIYNRELSLDNVVGIHPLNASDEKTIRLSVSTASHPVTSSSESPQKRSYTRSDDIPDDLPAGTVTHFAFAKQHSVNPRTFSDQITKGIGRGLEEKDKVDAIIKTKVNRPDETDKYLSPEQQEKALDFWRRHGTKFRECERPDCPCH